MRGEQGEREGRMEGMEISEEKEIGREREEAKVEVQVTVGEEE